MEIFKLMMNIDRISLFSDSELIGSSGSEFW